MNKCVMALCLFLFLKYDFFLLLFFVTGELGTRKTVGWKGFVFTCVCKNGTRLCM